MSTQSLPPPAVSERLATILYQRLKNTVGGVFKSKGIAIQLQPRFDDDWWWENEVFGDLAKTLVEELTSICNPDNEEKECATAKAVGAKRGPYALFLVLRKFDDDTEHRCFVPFWAFHHALDMQKTRTKTAPKIPSAAALKRLAESSIASIAKELQ